LTRRRISRALVRKVAKEIAALQPLRHPKSSVYQVVETRYLHIRRRRDAGYCWEQVIAELGLSQTAYVTVLLWYRELSMQYGLPHLTRSIAEQEAHAEATRRWAARNKS
jgi:hypothetical protein